MKRLLNTIQTGILIVLAAGVPVLVVVPEQYWFEKRIALAGAVVVMLALLAAKTWVQGSRFKVRGTDLGWGLLAAGMVVAAVVPAGRIANLMAPELWVGVGAVLAYFAIRNLLTNSRMVKLGFFAAAAGVAVGVVAMGTFGGVTPQTALEILQRSPIFGEFREFRVARLGILQIASGLGILGILGVLGLIYQLGLTAVKGILKAGSLWWKALNILVLVLLVGFLVLPHPALMLWPLAVTASFACGIVGGEGGRGGVGKRFVWAGFVGLLVVVILGSSYGLGRVVWGEMKFREALAAANRNEGIATYYALLESIKRNPYEVRYRLLASQIDIALANSIAAQSAAATGGEQGKQEEQGDLPAGRQEATPSAGLTAQDQNNILILIQQAVVEAKQAIKLDPENSLLWQNLASIYRALVGVAGGAEDWALKCYQRAIELAPKDPTPHLFIGEIHFLAGNFQGAADAFQEAVRLDPNFVRAHYNLAVAYNTLGEIDKAIEALEKVLAILPAEDPGREQVEKDLAFLKEGLSTPLEVETASPEAGETEELKEATTSAEVQPPPPPVGPEEATESAEPEEVELGE